MLEVMVCGCCQREDVFRGVVFDGLDSVFASSYVHTLHSVLKALNNRKHIYTVTLKNDFTTIKQHQKRLQADKGLSSALRATTTLQQGCRNWVMRIVCRYLPT